MDDALVAAAAKNESKILFQEVFGAIGADEIGALGDAEGAPILLPQCWQKLNPFSSFDPQFAQNMNLIFKKLLILSYVK